MAKVVKMPRDQKLKPVGLCPRDAVAFKSTNASPTSYVTPNTTDGYMYSLW